MTTDITKKDSNGATEDRRLTLKARGASGVIAGILLLVVAYYLFWPRTNLAAAPACEGIEGCTVSVSAPVDGVIAGVLFVLLTLFTLMAITGLVWVPTFGAGGLTIGQRAKATTALQVSANAVPIQPNRSFAAPAGPDEDSEEILSSSSLALWTELPISVQSAAVSFAEKEWDVPKGDLQISLIEASQDFTQPHAPYYLKFVLYGTEQILKVTDTASAHD